MLEVCEEKFAPKNDKEVCQINVREVKNIKNIKNMVKMSNNSVKHDGKKSNVANKKDWNE